MVGLAPAGIPLATLRLRHDAGRVTALQPDAVVEALGPGWRSGPLRAARTRRSRWRGLRPAPAGAGLVLATRSVHTRGMREALGVVSLGPGGEVRRAATLAPGRLFWDPGARWVIELPAERPLPPVGSVLALRPILAP